MRVMDVLSEATNTIAEGEVQQLLNSHDPEISEISYIDVIQSKTAKLFEAAGRLGAILSERSLDDEEAMAKYGMHLGTAFQLTDDMLDYDGVSNVTGKPTGGHDLKEGKITLPIIYAQRIAEGAERERLTMLIEDPDVDSSWPEILEFVHRYGGIEYTMEVARRFIDEARQNLELLPASEGRDAIEEIMEFILSREH